jgi:hypothetical protein
VGYPSRFIFYSVVEVSKETLVLNKIFRLRLSVQGLFVYKLLVH